ncbi:hypothetical protein B0T20DRAFT_66824 [Sordaria brevicollis]|uniref:Uncharacterized protein n=1 Tax=Sordaria brevicollis TaxID=83679 RepID=A0AAE0P2J4_SORBR|nr:hypothetical protein B0T20DRAFT_66824 [Sordaria brevicollis]
MAPLPSPISETLTMGLLLSRSCSNDYRYGCGSIPADKRPILIVVGVIVAIIVISVILCSCGCCTCTMGERGAGNNNNNNAQGQGGNSGDGNTAGGTAGAPAVPDVPPPMYQEAGAPPPTYQRETGDGGGQASVERPQPRYA